MSFLNSFVDAADMRGGVDAYLKEGGSRGKHGFPRGTSPKGEVK